MTKMVGVCVVVFILVGAYLVEQQLRSEHAADDYSIAQSLIRDNRNSEAIAFIRSSGLVAKPQVLDDLLLDATGRFEMVVGAPIQHERYPFRADVQIIDFLILAGANPNYSRPPSSETALTNAIYHDDIRAVIRLLMKGACPNAREGSGSLQLARLHKHDEIEKVLLWFEAVNKDCETSSRVE